MAVAGAALGAALLAAPMTRGETQCASVLGHLTGEGDLSFPFADLPDLPSSDDIPDLQALRDLSVTTPECADARRGRAVLSLALAGLGLLPLVGFAVRGLLWGADTLHELERRVPPPPDERKR